MTGDSPLSSGPALDDVMCEVAEEGELLQLATDEAELDAEPGDIRLSLAAIAVINS